MGTCNAMPIDRLKRAGAGHTDAALAPEAHLASLNGCAARGRTGLVQNHAPAAGSVIPIPQPQAAA